VILVIAYILAFLAVFIAAHMIGFKEGKAIQLGLVKSYLIKCPTWTTEEIIQHEEEILRGERKRDF